MTEGSFIHGGATAVHEKPPVLTGEIVTRRFLFTDDVRAHMRVLGPSTLLDQLSVAHRYAASRSVLSDSHFSPTAALFADFAEADPEKWGAVLRLVADVIAEAPAASRA